MSGWRVWFAFEVKPGVTVTSQQDHSELWGKLAESCRDASGMINAVEYDKWLTCFIEHAHLWGQA